MIEVTNHPLSDWKSAVLSVSPSDLAGPIPPADFLPKLGCRSTEPSGKSLGCLLVEGIFLMHTYFMI